MGRRKREAQSTPEVAPPTDPTSPDQRPAVDTGTPSQQSQRPVAAVQAEAREKFLDSMRAGNTVRESVRRAGVGRATLFRWRDTMDQFGKDWAAAVKEGDEAILQEIHNRAVVGDDVNVYNREGVLIDTIKKKSDILLIVYAKIRGIFRENMVVEHHDQGEVLDARVELLKLLRDRSQIKAPDGHDPRVN